MASDYEKKMIEMQFQLRENQQYLSDAFKDLENWSGDMKVKEEKLINNSNRNDDIASEKTLPPVRNLATVKKKKKIKKTSKNETNDKKTTKIKAYDYRNWDKFDVDAACMEIDEKKSSSSSDYTTDEEWEEEQKKNRANWEKERGNLFLKDNLYDDAINCYTRAIELDQTNAIFPANRAMCLLKQEKYAAAEVDCTLSITLDPKYVKAFHRRGTARIGLKKLNEAKEDFEEVLKLEPFNKEAQKELIKIEKEVESMSIVFPIDKQIDKRSKKPLKRIQIQEINSDVDRKLEAARQEIKSKIKLNESDEKLFSISENKAEKSKNENEEVKIKKKVEKVEEKKFNKNIVIPSAPTNGFQFRKDWQMLANNLDDLAVYFKQIPPDFYPKLFMNGLESDMLSKIFLLLQKYLIQDENFDAFNYMNSLSQVKRFHTQILFFSNDDKTVIHNLLDHVKKSSNRTKNEIEELEKRYI